MYQYLNRPPQVGDVVCWNNMPKEVTNRINGKPYIVLKTTGGIVVIKDENNQETHFGFAHDFHVIATKPASEALPGDTMVSLTNYGPTTRQMGTIHEVVEYNPMGRLRYKDLEHGTAFCEDFHEIVVLRKAPRIAVVTKNVGGHPIGSHIVRLNDSSYWILADGSSLATYKHTIGCNCKWLDTLPINEPGFIQVDESLTIPNQTKETQMQLTMQQLLTKLFGNEKPTTDYDRRPNYLVVAYNRDGSEMGTATAPDIEAVQAKVANSPELWGCKVLTYKLNKEVFVDVPVTVVKATRADVEEE